MRRWTATPSEVAGRGSDRGDRRAPARRDAELCHDRRRGASRAALVDDRRALRRRAADRRVDRGLASRRRSRAGSTSCRRASPSPTRARAPRPISSFVASMRCSASQPSTASCSRTSASRSIAATPSASSLREGWLLVIGGPFALWGRINHWLPFRAARAVAMRSVDSAADPAMRTLVAGTAFVAR